MLAWPRRARSFLGKRNSDGAIANLFQIGFIKTVSMDRMLPVALGHERHVTDGLMTGFAKFHHIVHTPLSVGIRNWAFSPAWA